MQKIIIDLNNPHGYQFDVAIEPILQTILSHLNNKENSILSVALVNNQEISQLYEEYFGYAQSTDVLSFPSGSFDPETNCILLGDVLIDFPFVEKQAKRLGNELNAELTLLLIHGILHLLGYDHDNDFSKKEMWNLQTELMTALNITLRQIPE